MNRIQDDIATELTCSSCNKPLSVFPVFVTETEQSICGRCFPNNPEKLLRNVAYEKIASSFLFPCAFVSEGCLEYHYPKDMADHESQYHEIMCPSDKISECNWKGGYTDLLAHCEELHPTTILNGTFALDLINTNEAVNIVTYADQVFFFKRHFNANSNLLHCWVGCFIRDERIKRYNYEIVLKAYKGHHSMTFPEKLMDPDSSCAIEINMADVKMELNHPSSIVGEINIAPIMDSKRFNPDAISELECPICIQYMTSTIYMCEVGHSLCKPCKNSVTQCPLCKTKLTNKRNITLEKVAHHLEFPCKYTGCTFISKPEKLQAHKEFCYQKQYSCPILDYEFCRWSGYVKHIPDHIRESHPESFLTAEPITVAIDNKYLYSSDSRCFITHFSNRIFKLHYWYEHPMFRWAMQMVGPPEESKNFMFEIEVVDNKKNHKILYMRNQCQPITLKNVFLGNSGYIWFFLNQLEPLITDVFTYRVHISIKN